MNILNNTSGGFFKGLLVSILLLNVSAGYADDIEIFLGNDVVHERNRPNVLFLIDDSLSMDWDFTDSRIEPKVKGNGDVERDENGNIIYERKNVQIQRISALREAFDKAITGAGQINVGLMALNNDSYVGVHKKEHKRYMQKVRYIDDPLNILEYSSEGSIESHDDATEINKQGATIGDRFLVMGYDNVKNPENRKKVDRNLSMWIGKAEIIGKTGTTETVEVIHNPENFNNIWYSSKEKDKLKQDFDDSYVYSCSVAFDGSKASERCADDLMEKEKDKKEAIVNNEKISVDTVVKYITIHHDYGLNHTFMLFDGLDIPPGAKINKARLIIEPRDIKNPADLFEIALEATKVAQPFEHDSVIGQRRYSGYEGNNLTSNYWNHVGQLTSPLRFYKAVRGKETDDYYFDYKQLTGVKGKYNNTDVVFIDFTNALKNLHEKLKPNDPMNSIMLRFIGKWGEHASEYVNFFFKVEGSELTPRLEVEFEPVTTINKRMTGLRFQNVRIPQGAVIEDAFIRFKSAALSENEELEFKICGEKSSNAKPFTKGEHLSNRAKFRECITWKPGRWVLEYPSWYVRNNSSTHGTYEISVKPILQKIVNQADWCGFNAVAFFIEPVRGSGNRVTYAVDYPITRFTDTKNPTDKNVTTVGNFENYQTSEDIKLNPVLDYTLVKVKDSKGNDIILSKGNSCSNTQFKMSVVGGVDDGYQWDDWYPNLWLRWLHFDDYIGVRYAKTPINKGAKIQEANIWIRNVHDQNSQTGKVVKSRLYIEQTSNSLQLTEKKEDISKRILKNQNYVDIECKLGKPEERTKCYSPGLKDRLTEFFARPDWEAGNPLTLILDTSAKRQPGIYQPYIKAREDAPREGVVLEVRMKEQEHDPKKGYTVRDYINLLVQSLPPRGLTPTVPALYDAARYFTGMDGKHYAPTEIKSIENEYENWRSPIEYKCQNNHIIFLSDGEPLGNWYWNQARDLIGKECIWGRDGNLHVNLEQDCAFGIAKWLANNHHAPEFNSKNELIPKIKVNGKTVNQNIKTHTVAFQTTDYATRFLNGLANAGNGKFYEAKSTDELADAINDILNYVTDINANFTNTSVSIDNSNRIKHSDKLYFSLFKPSLKQKWHGNLKRYRFLNGQIVDKNDESAIDDVTGTFKKTAHSFWSSEVDGDNTIEGGASSHLPSPKTRNLFTCVEKTNKKHCELVKLDEHENKITNTMLGVRDDIERRDMLKYVRYVGNNYKSSSGTDISKNQTRGKWLADAIHSSPRVINYDLNKQSVIWGSNEGFLHIFDAETGIEQSAFMAPEFLSNIKKFWENKQINPNNPKIYGFDNTVVVWHDDSNADKLWQAGEKIYAYATMRRGGSSIYALDVSVPKEPKLVWTIKYGDKGFETLGQTWSEPVKTKIPYQGTIKDVLIFGGGYDEANDFLDKNNSIRIENSKGNSIYIVDARTGELLWSAGNPNNPYGFKPVLALNDMKYSIPSRVRVIASQEKKSAKSAENSITNQFFVGDVGGQVWRFFVNPSASNKSDLIIPSGGFLRDKRGVFASISKDNSPQDARKFYHEPDIVAAKIEGKQALIVNVGSGYRAHPLNKIIEDRFYSIRTTNLSNPDSDITVVYESDMYDATYNLIRKGNDQEKSVAETIMQDPNSSWYIRMGVGKKVNGSKGVKQAKDKGEKIITTPLTIDGKIFFNTYEPSVNFNEQTCEPQPGVSRSYMVNLFDATPAYNDLVNPDDLENSYTEIKSPGLPGNPTHSVDDPYRGRGKVITDPSNIRDTDIYTPVGAMYWIDRFD